MKKITLNETDAPSLGTYLPVKKNENFESNATNITKAKENARRIIAQYGKDPAFKKEFTQALSNGEADENIGLTVAILSHISGVKAPTNIKREKANLGKTKISSDEQAEAQKLLSSLYDMDFEKITDSGVSGDVIEKANEIIASKYEGQPEEEPEEEEPEADDDAEGEEPEADDEEEPAKEEPIPEAPKEKPATQPVKPEETPKGPTSIDKIGDRKPSEVVTELKARFESEAEKALGLVKKMGYNEKAAAKVVEDLRGKFTKNVNGMLKQEDAFTGDYGFNTKSRATQAINLALNNANYMIDSIKNRSFLKSSPSTIALVGRQAAETLSNVGKAIKGKATNIYKSKPMQDVMGGINKAYQTAKGATAKTIDKVAEKILAREQEKKAAASPEGQAKAAEEQKVKDEAKSKKQAESQAKMDAIKGKISGAAKKVADTAKAAGSAVAGGIKKMADVNAAKKKPVEAPDIDAVNADLAKKNAASLTKSQPVLAGQIDKTQATDVGKPTPIQPPAVVTSAQPPVKYEPKPGDPSYWAWKRQQLAKGQAQAAKDLEAKEEEKKKKKLYAINAEDDPEDSNRVTRGKNLERDEYTGRTAMASNASANVEAMKKRLKKR